MWLAEGANLPMSPRRSDSHEDAGPMSGELLRGNNLLSTNAKRYDECVIGTLCDCLEIPNHDHDKTTPRMW
jgi:hypothetical protein